MASFGFNVRIYGEVDEQPPYIPDSHGNLACATAYKSTSTLTAGLPTENINVWPIADPGAVMNGSVSCYSVIEIPTPGLQLHSRKYVVQQTVAQITTLRNA